MTLFSKQKQRKQKRVSTGVAGLDAILGGGLPDLSINIIMGRPGTGKTILTHQTIFANLRDGQRALYLTTLSEPAMKMLRYLQEFSFVDAAKMGQELMYLDIGEHIAEKGISEPMAYIFNIVRDHKPSIVAVDSFKAVHDLSTARTEMRKFGFDLAVHLTTWGVTAFLVGEYSLEDIQNEPIFAIADSILCLHYETKGLHTQRFIEVAKVRGSDYFSGLHPYITSSDGLKVYPRMRTPDTFEEQRRTGERVKSNLPELDQMLGGGLPRGSATMLAGGAGTGKTLLGLHFIAAAAARNEHALIVSYQETPGQLTDIARSFGWDLAELSAKGLVKYLYHSPVEIQPDIHFSEVRDVIKQIDAKIVLIDSLKDLEIATPDKTRYKDYIYSLVNEFKVRGLTLLLTNEIMELFGPFTLSEHGVSFIADNVVLLRYVELAGRMSRALSVMKMRGSQHSKEIFEFEIGSGGLRLLKPIRAVTGVLTGMPALGETGMLLHLPAHARHLLLELQRRGQLSAADLAQSTGISLEEVQRELSSLQQQGLVLAIVREGTELFKATT
jgi:circadian clock protein KaiC